MKTPAELIAELQHILFEVDGDDLAVRDYAHLFALMTAHPDFGANMEGMNRLSWVIHEHAKTIYCAHERMSEIVRKLANP